MSARLTIVVTCTNRKSLRVAPEMCYRSVPQGTSSERLAFWQQGLTIAKDIKPLATLYQGEQWQQSLALVTAAKQVGFTPNLLVVSAGLGLRAINTESPAYSATFVARQPDAVAPSPLAAQEWWAELTSSSGSRLADIKGRTLLVLSSTYALPVAQDLMRLATSGADHVLIGGARDVPGTLRIKSDAGLRKALGGTLSSINPRMATQLLRLAHDPSDWLSRGHLGRWKQWAKDARVVERYDRIRRTDVQVRRWIHEAVSKQQLSATRALGQYRNQGLACEQSRFGCLFREVTQG